jgi:hypothetical protein
MAPVERCAGVTDVIVGLEIALYRDRRRRLNYHSLKGGPGVALAVAATTEANVPQHAFHIARACQSALLYFTASALAAALAMVRTTAKLAWLPRPEAICSTPVALVLTDAAAGRCHARGRAGCPRHIGRVPAQVMTAQPCRGSGVTGPGIGRTASTSEPLSAHRTLLPGTWPWRYRATRWQRALAIMLLVAFERRRKNADQVEIAMRVQFVPVLGTDIVCNARFERP